MQFEEFQQSIQGFIRRLYHGESEAAFILTDFLREYADPFQAALDGEQPLLDRSFGQLDLHLEMLNRLHYLSGGNDRQGVWLAVTEYLGELLARKCWDFSAQLLRDFFADVQASGYPLAFTRVFVRNSGHTLCYYFGMEVETRSWTALLEKQVDAIQVGCDDIADNDLKALVNKSRSLMGMFVSFL